MSTGAGPAERPARAEERVAVIGLGYVGLPLAAAFGERLDTVGFDISHRRVEELRAGRDRTREVSEAELARAARLRLSSRHEDLADRSAYLVTVPTPIDANRQPDLAPLEAAARTVGEVLGPGELVVFESTVFPGATEEVCLPLLERASGLRAGQDFDLGYSPERINPGDHSRRLADIVKITAGSTPEAAERVERLYRQVVRAGTHRVSSIRVAEAAKVIENTQRDLNIALANELALIFHELAIDTREVLEAAATKWNFLPFEPGLVGGHCVGVDPYYLTYRALKAGYQPEVILAGRKLNDRMGQYVASRVIKLMARRRMPLAGARALVLGLSFKENCPDLRNSRVIDLVRELESYGLAVDVHDPVVDPADARREFGLELTRAPAAGSYDALVLAVRHDRFRALGADGIRGYGRPGHVLFDVKAMLPAGAADGRL